MWGIDPTERRRRHSGNALPSMVAAPLAEWVYSEAVLAQSHMAARWMASTTNELSVRLVRQQTALAEFGELAIRSNNLNEILTEACRLVSMAIGTDLAKVVELQADGHTLLVVAGVGWKPGVVGIATIEAGDDTTEGVALKTMEPMISPDITTETRFRYPAFLTDNNVRAVSNVPILGEKGEQPFGILQVDSHQTREFSLEDTTFLRTYANLLAAAVVRIKTYKTLEAKTAELETKTLELERKTLELTTANTNLLAEAAERLRVEEALHQSQKMEAVGQLTGGLAHDFNNMLAGISGSLELIRIRSGQGRKAELEHYIENALETTSRAAALTHRLLAFSRRQTLDPKITDLNRLVLGMENLLRRTVGPTIEVDIRLTTAPWLTLCDASQVESALLNLVINARDAMPGGGRLAIVTENVSHSQNGKSNGTSNEIPKGDYEALYVTDTGSGMPPDVLNRAFDPFFTTKPLGQGTGLGLSMVHGFVQQSGGRVQLASKEGLGTTVAIYLPRHDGILADEIDVTHEALRHDVHNNVVLLVEDEPVIRDVVLDLLGNLGYRMMEANDGPAGLAILETTLKIDLLITDIGLPGMNGRQLVDAARQRRPDLKVLFITGYAAGALMDKGILGKGMQVLPKPFALNVLAAKVQGILALPG